MIAGNPKAGRMLAVFALALLILIAVSTALIASRKKTPPKTVPLRPASLIFHAFTR